MALNKTMSFDLELKPGGIPPIIHASQGDIGRMFKANIYWDGAAATSYISGATVNLRGKKPDKTVFDYTATLAGSMVTFETTEQMTIISGPVECELVFSNDGDIIASANFVLMVEDSPYNPDAPSESVVPGIEDLIEQTIGGDVSDEVDAWLDAHPEVTTTVQDGSITEAKLATGAVTSAKVDADFLKTIENAYVTPEMFDAIENGVVNISKLEQMFTYASANNKNVLFTQDCTFNFVAGSTIDEPTRVLIKNASNMVIDGNGHTVNMVGLTKTYLDSINDEASSGRDIFTFLSLTLCDNITVKNFNIVGEHIYDRDVRFRYVSPRQKGIGLVGSNNCKVENCNFDGMFGNGVNMTPSSNSRDSEWRNANNNVVQNCSCSNSLENAFNNMGNTNNNKYYGLNITNSQGGIETGTGHTFIDNVSINNCRTMLSIGGEDVITNVIGINGGITIDPSEGKMPIISNSRFTLDSYIQIYAGTSLTLTDCHFEKSSDNWFAPYNYWLYAVGSTTKANGVIKINNVLAVFDFGLICNYQDTLQITNSRLINTAGGTAVVLYNTPIFLLIGTIYKGSIAGTPTNDNYRIT